MSRSIVTYLQDHLAGANFAINLLQVLSQQSTIPEAAEIAGRLLPEIDADKELLERLIKEIGGDPSLLNEAMAWVSQKVTRVKLRLSEPIGVFEAVEMLCLGVLGKLSLWFALEPFSDKIPWLDLKQLAERARTQHAIFERLRRKLATVTLVWN